MEFGDKDGIEEAIVDVTAFPTVEVRKLFAIVGNIDRILLAQVILIGLVAGVAIAVSIYNSMSERRRENAILRALDARRGTIFAIVVWGSGGQTISCFVIGMSSSFMESYPDMPASC